MKYGWHTFYAPGNRYIYSAFQCISSTATIVDDYKTIERAILSVDVFDKENYLKWVSQWKKLLTYVEKDITLLKRKRKTAKNGYVAELRLYQNMATDLLKYRKIYKLTTGVLREKRFTNSR